MRLFDFVEEHHRIGAAADLLGKLSRLVIADIAGRRADDPRNRMLLHKLGHIEPDERIRGVEQLLRESAHQLGLADSRRSDKDKGSRTAAGRKLHPRAAHRGGNQLDRPILPDNILFQGVGQMGYLSQLARLDL